MRAGGFGPPEQRTLERMAERLELLIPERRIRARVMALGGQTGAKSSGKKLSLVVVLRGACICAADLMRQIEIPFTIDFITAASYGESARSSGTVALSGLDRLDLAGRDVLVIEDILDTGRTSAALRDGLRQHGSASFALCTLLRKPAAAGSIFRSPMSVSTFATISSSATAWITPSATAICRASTAWFSRPVKAAPANKNPRRSGGSLVYWGIGSASFRSNRLSAGVSGQRMGCHPGIAAMLHSS